MAEQFDEAPAEHFFCFSPSVQQQQQQHTFLHRHRVCLQLLVMESFWPALDRHFGRFRV